VSELARLQKAHDRFRRWFSNLTPATMHLYLRKLTEAFLPEMTEMFDGFGIMFVKRVTRGASCAELLEMHRYIGFMDGVTFHAAMQRRMNRRVRLLFEVVLSEMLHRVEDRMLQTCR